MIAHQEGGLERPPARTALADKPPRLDPRITGSCWASGVIKEAWAHPLIHLINPGHHPVPLLAMARRRPAAGLASGINATSLISGLRPIVEAGFAPLRVADLAFGGRFVGAWRKNAVR